MRDILTVAHGNGYIRVVYDRIDEGSEGAGLDVLVNGIKAGRFYSPEEVNSWFARSSKANLEAWKAAFHKAGLASDAFVRPAFRGDVSLDVPYLSQRDNEKNPFGACNVTCYAMAFEFFKVPRRNDIINPRTKKPFAQREDEISAFMEKNGRDRHAHDDLAWMGRQYGLHCSFSTTRTFDEIISEIRSGNPVIVSTVLTSAGHIILLRGVEGTNFIVNDPFGDYREGYQGAAGRKGKGVLYSFDLMRRKMRAANDSHKWAHFLRSGS